MKDLRALVRLTKSCYFCNVRTMNRFITLFILLLLPLCVIAQKKQIATAQDQIKSGKDLDKAEKSMSTLLKDSLNSQNPKIWLTLHEALLAQYRQGNEKLYLKQKYDTASIFQVTYKLFETDEAFDSIFCQRNKVSKKMLKLREKNSTLLHQIKPNLFNGGTFFINKHQYATAFSFLNLYLRMDTLPIFRRYNYAQTDTLRPQAAYWAMYCGYKLKDANKTLLYSALAEKDSARLAYVRQYEAETFLLRKDTANYVQALLSGFYNYPKFPFFFPRLVEYYNHKEDYKQAENIINHALDYDSLNVVFRYAQANTYLNMGQYDKCIDVCKQLLAGGDTIAEAYYVLGLAYFNQAIELDKVQQNYEATRRKIAKLYKLALPYLEQYRALAPDEKEKWLAPLYTIYLNLNMGKQFDEIDHIRNEYRRNNP